jgi:beta-N-acetylhexosaminidase
VKRLALLAAVLAGCGGAAKQEPTATPTSHTVATVRVDSHGRAHLTGELESPTATVTATPTAGATPRSGPREPHIVSRPIPFGARRKREMAAYSRRHYGDDTYKLTNPHVIVEHFTVTTTFQAAYDTFAADVPDSELHELPSTCAHFVVDKDGTIYQLVPLSIRCRHTVGLNYTAIGIEQVGMSAQEILARPKQVASIVALSAWLRCRYHIKLSDVIGHAESLSSPYHHEDVASLRHQTHADWTTPYARRLRKKIGAVAC